MIKIPPLNIRKTLTILFGNAVAISEKGVNEAIKMIGVKLKDIKKALLNNTKVIQCFQKNKYDIVIETNPIDKNIFLYLCPKSLTLELINNIDPKLTKIMSMTVLIGEINNYEVRLGVYGVPCNELSRGMIHNGPPKLL